MTNDEGSAAQKVFNSFLSFEDYTEQSEGIIECLDFSEEKFM